MQLHKTFLAGIALAALGAGAVMAGNESTPAEKEQTRQLNEQAIINAQGVPLDQAPPAWAATLIVDNSAATLAGMTNPPPIMANANVVSSDGMMVGLVQKIQLDADGKPVSLDVALKDSGRTVSFDAHQMSYNAIDNIVIARASRDEIMGMPGSLPPG